MFGGKRLCEIINQDSDFENAKFVIVPNTSRPKKQMIQTYNATKKFFTDHYGNDAVIDGYDEKTGEFYDRSEMFDVVYIVSPYEVDKHEFHSPLYLSKQNLLPFFIQYGICNVKFGTKAIASILGINFLWRVFLNNKFDYDGFKKYGFADGKNAVISGYAKMDDFVNSNKTNSNKKRIIIAPHHSIKGSALEISNFLYYSDLLLELPKMFPNVEFIFRPHPHLFVNLLNFGFWSENQISEYLEKIKSIMTYSVGGDYLDIFANADGIVHDCASFISEWLYSEKKGCYVSFDGNIFNKISELGEISLKFYDIAKNKDDIISYIKRVEDGTNEPINLNNVKKNIMVNYPNASQFIVDEIKKALK
ncbi:hypothetical protein OFO01_06425 [Campylobacter sp. JMF_01 NE2]|nr:hypothetical protein [Campylobacter sp. JMF_01 NE2]